MTLILRGLIEKDVDLKGQSSEAILSLKKLYFSTLQELISSGTIKELKGFICVQLYHIKLSY